MVGVERISNPRRGSFPAWLFESRAHLLQGDTRNLPLVNIFQTLALNQQDGVLSISYRGKTRRVGLRGDRLILLTEEDHRSRSLPQVLQRLRLMTGSEYENVFSALPAPRPPGDVLLETRLISAAQLNGPIKEQLSEQIFEIFRWIGAKYRFDARPLNSPLLIFSSTEVERQLSIPVNSVLMEVARRDDEWARIDDEISNRDEIFRFIGNFEALPPPEAGRAREIAAEFDGTRALSDIIERSPLPEFVVCSALREFLEQGAVQPLSVEEKREIIERSVHDMSMDQLGRVYQSILHDDPSDLDIRRRLYFLLEKQQAPKEKLAVHARELAVAAEHAGDAKLQREWLDRHLDADPQSVPSLGDLLMFPSLQKREKDWRQVRRRFFQAIYAQKAFEEGADLLDRIIDSRPSDTSLLIDSASVFAACGRGNIARDVLVQAAQILCDHRDRPNLLKVYTKLKDIDAKAAQRFKRPLENMERTGSASGGSGILKPVAIVLVLLSAVGLLVAYEWSARVAYAEVIEAAQGHADGGDLESARSEIRSFLDKYRWSFFAQTLPDLEAEFTEKNPTNSTVNNDPTTDPVKDPNPTTDPVDAPPTSTSQMESMLTNAAGFLKRGDYVEAYEIYSKLDVNQLPLTAREVVVAEMMRLETYFAGAAKLEKRLHAAEIDQDWKTANLVGQQIFDEYPHSAIGKALRLPVLVEPVPPRGTRIRVGDEIVEGPPYIVRSRSVVGVRATAEAPGHEPLDFRVDPLSGWRMSIQLQKLPSAEISMTVPIEASATQNSNGIYFGARDGQVHAIDPANGEPRWSHSLPGLSDVAVGIQLDGDRLVFPATDGAIYGLRADDGEPLFRISLPNRMGYAVQPLARAPHMPNGIVVATKSGWIALVDLDSEQVVWTVDSGISQIFGLHVQNGSIVVGNRLGYLRAFHASDGRPKWDQEFHCEVTTPLVKTSNGLIFASPESAIRVNADTGKFEKKSLGTHFVGGAAASDSKFYGTTLDDRVVAVDLESATVEWTARARVDSDLGIVERDGVLYGVSKDGVVSAIDAATGDLQWTHRTESRPGARLAVTAGAVVFVGIDGKLVSIPR